MNAVAIVEIVLRILTAAPSLVQAVEAVTKLKALLVDGKEPSEAEIEALLATLNQQSDEIQGIANADRIQANEGSGS